MTNKGQKAPKQVKATKSNKAEEVIECDDAAREAYAATALAIDDDAFLVKACDGDDEYVYVVAKEGKRYGVTEVYPGLRKRETAARKASRPIDLVFDQTYASIEAVLKTIDTVLFEDFEFEKPAPKRAEKSANDQQTPQLAAVG